MCCLFGIIDRGHSLTTRQRRRVLSVLATECEARGTDATGIAYNSGGGLRIYKRPLPAHRMGFRLPEDATVIMGHTRMTTQGSEKRNYNNHPFRGCVDGVPFALAHNGVLYNDRSLRKTLALPHTRIETDSFIAVQLIQREQALTFSSLKRMAEQVEGSFAFTVLDRENRLYFIKGDNPICLVHFPGRNLYLYASTKEILGRALKKLRFPLGEAEQVPLSCGDLLCVGADGAPLRGSFDSPYLRYSACCKEWGFGPLVRSRVPSPIETYTDGYAEELKSVAVYFGYAPEDIDTLLQDGFTPEELEEMFYCGEL